MYRYILKNQEIPLKECFRQDIFQIKDLKILGLQVGQNTNIML